MFELSSVHLVFVVALSAMFGVIMTIVVLRRLKVHSEQNGIPDVSNREMLLEEVIEGMDQGIVAFSKGNIDEREIVLVNTRLQEMMELPAEMARLGLSHNQMLSFFEQRGDLAETEKAKLARFRNSPGKSEHLGLTYKLPSGRFAQSLGGTRKDGTGRIVTFTDITDVVNSERERASLNENLCHMQRIKSVGQLTGGVAHDFNNLLAVISGNAELLQMDMGSDNSSIDEILQSVHRGSELTQRLLAFSRKQTLRPMAIDTKEMIDGVSSMLQRTLGEAITIRAETEPGLWNCFADRGQIENAILNLAVNARDAMPEGGSLDIRVSNEELTRKFCDQHSDLMPGRYVRISVADTGTGIPESQIAEVFDPFFTTKEIGEGSGLGLSMVYGFIKQSNGHIEIRSVEGSGATVCLLLPATHELAKPKTKTVQSRHAPRREKTIVVVEDNPSVQDFIVRALSSLGYKTRSFSSAREALWALDKDDTMDLLLTDIVMPGGMNGADLGRKLRTDRPDLRILYMSGNVEGLKRTPTVLDADIPVLRKPFSIDYLAQSLERELAGLEDATASVSVDDVANLS